MKHLDCRGTGLPVGIFAYKIFFKYTMEGLGIENVGLFYGSNSGNPVGEDFCFVSVCFIY
jgi:hypothetical protein